MNQERGPDCAAGDDGDTVEAHGTTPDVAELVAEHQGIAARLARRYSPGTRPDADLVQVGMLGLVLAAQRYDPQQGPFKPYAVATVSGELKKHLRSAGWAVSVPRRVQEASLTVESAAVELEQTLGRSPTPAEVSERTGLSVEAVLSGFRATRVRFSDELPTTVGLHRGDTDSPAEVLDIRNAVEQLPEDDHSLLRMRFELQLTQREIAATLGVSQTQVHRKLVAVMDHLRVALAGEEYP